MSSVNRLLLGVNIDHVATLRQARGTRYPDPVKAALDAEEAGADGITLHLREDRRHIQERDVQLLKSLMLTRMNLEMAVTEEMLSFAEAILPAHCCLVPEKREELTTEGGLDILAHQQRVADAVARLTRIDCEASLFIDPDFKQIQAAADCGAPVIEIHTGHYADASTSQQQSVELDKIKQSVKFALECGLIVNAGHGLNYHNVEAIAEIPGLTELNIGHAIIARALTTGLKVAVSDMKKLMNDAMKS
ncbi:MAG: pyridoxine 5'-phosphate synthase [Pseudomonadales bacterium]|nr:pyridoxine 5'-phosphate synthase [Pseudomonadales bacterium]